ncbi:hypothetical protein KFL_007860060 [Klebsormidium nitens]|uniref:Uncharacterized protein n=1 Tax=Klebsormidium nitens TaxID=105231 RepID=A0A1Y1IKY0_KLENI|nr:hypothetical protein KFL_007860060 [Klebsormidium nitens]|eukprot:GAQ91444.1 hypothetical protein KFL_007860060 [Klebsormidium nitens]
MAKDAGKVALVSVMFSPFRKEGDSSTSRYPVVWDLIGLCAGLGAVAYFQVQKAWSAQAIALVYLKEETSRLEDMHITEDKVTRDVKVIDARKRVAETMGNQADVIFQGALLAAAETESLKAEVAARDQYLMVKEAVRIFQKRYGNAEPGFVAFMQDFQRTERVETLRQVTRVIRMIAREQYGNAIGAEGNAALNVK